MTTTEDLLAQSLMPPESGNFLARIEELERRVESLTTRNFSIQSLDEVVDDLGMIQYGEFRSGNDHEPGDGFSGSRIGYPGFDYNGEEYAWALVNEDVLEIGFSLTSKKAVFAGGNATIGADGIIINQMSYLIQHTATDGVTERTGAFGMWAKPGGTEPCYGLAYSAPVSETELVVNGGFESGDFTGWTKTTESNGTWAVDSDAYEGSYAAHFSANNKLEKTGVLTLDRISVTELTNYRVTAAIKAVLAAEVVGHAKVQVKWYDAASGGTLLQTDQVAYIETATAINYTNFVTTLVAPSGALSCEFVCTAYKHAYATRNLAVDVHFDGISLKSVSLNSTLYFDYLGKLRLNDNLFVPDSWFGAFSQFRAYRSDGTEYEPSTRSFDPSNFYMGLGQLNGDYFTNNVLLAAGTYTLQVFRAKGSSYGKFDVYVDGVKVTSTPLDFYNSTSVESNVKISGIVIHSDGVHEIKFLNAGKNASSSGYNLVMKMMGLYRTA